MRKSLTVLHVAD